MSEYYPISLNLSGRRCLVVGGGAVAARKVAALLEAGAAVTVVAPDAAREVLDLSARGRVTYVRRAFAPADLGGCFVAVAATDDPGVNRAVSQAARERRVLVNVVDDAAISDYIVPAVTRRGSLCIAVTTDGKSPLLARRVRERLEADFGPEYGQFLDWLGEARETIRREEPNESRRRAIFARLVDSGVLALLREGRAAEARDEFERLLREPTEQVT
ncbi:MAG: precorrin-2 dehydrogenase/sirohydrochlorin ferrochelatase family protein [Bacillota bacterium]